MEIQADLATLRAKIRSAMIGRVDNSVFVLNLVDLALDSCEGLLSNEVTGAVSLADRTVGIVDQHPARARG